MRSIETGGRLALPVLLAFSFATTAKAQDEGVKMVEQLTKRAGSTAQAVTEAKLQFVKTMTAYNAVLADDAKDRKGLYKKLQSEMEDTEKRRADVVKADDAMKLEADTVFKSWGDSTAAISNADLKKRSEERLTKTKARVADIQAAGQKAAAAYAPIMNTLKDQVTYLGHDLNAESVASLKKDSAKVNAQAQDLEKLLDEMVTTINTNTAALRPQ